MRVESTCKAMLTVNEANEDTISTFRETDASDKGSRELCARVYRAVVQIPLTLSATRAYLLTQS